MFDAPTAPAPSGSRLGTAELWLRVGLVLALLFVFLTGVGGMGSGFKALGKDVLDSFFSATSNPFVALVIGILGTTLVQSSSVSTSMIVAMVGAGTLSIEGAVPMIMGANIGTTVTNTIVSLGHASRPEEFRRAFAAATCHDFFNFMAVAILLPLEIATGVLQKLSREITTLIAGSGGGEYPNPMKDATKAALEPFMDLFAAITDNARARAILLIVFSAVIIFASLWLIVKVLRSVSASSSEGFLTRALGKSAYLGILVGIVVTVMVQSSSITTSTMIPLAGAGLITLEAVFPITVGANIGTTITALLASLALPPEALHLGLQIALVHLLFNLCATLIIFVPPYMRQIPLRMSRGLADLAVRSRKLALAYIVGLFYGLPGLLIGASRMF